MKADRPKAVVLLSGGLDSATALAVAARAGFDCLPLAVDYGQRHAAELDAAMRVAAAQGVALPRRVAVDLRAFGGSALTGDDAVPKGRAIDESIPVTYVPARNLVLLSLATAFAEAAGARDIFIGVNALDYSGYPDCRREFIDAFEVAAIFGTKAGEEGGRFAVRTPLVDMAKAAIILLGSSLGVDYSLAVSCYDADAAGRACGECDSCQLRRKGFADAGIPDPTRYR